MKAAGGRGEARQYWALKTRLSSAIPFLFAAGLSACVIYLELQSDGDDIWFDLFVIAVCVPIALRGLTIKIWVENGDVVCRNQFRTHRVALSSVSEFEVAGTSTYYVGARMKDGSTVRMVAIAALVPRDHNRRTLVHHVVDDLNSLLQEWRQGILD